MKFIIFTTLILLIVYIYLYNNIENENYSNQIDTYDVIMVGGGLTSLYLCSKLLSINNSLKILVLEKENYFGGQLLNNSHMCEFGAMRFFPSIHPKMAKLVKELNLPIKKVNLYTGDMILRDKLYKITDSIEKTAIDYHLTKTDKQIVSKFKDINNIIQEHFDNVMKEDIKNFDITNLEQRKNLTIKYSNLNYRNELITNYPNFSEDFFNYYQDTNSYSDIWNEEMSFALGYIFNIASQDVKDQYFFTNGTQSLINALINKCKSFSNQIHFQNNSQVVSINRVNNINYINYVKDLKKQYSVVCNKLFINIPHDLIQNIPVTINHSIIPFIKNKHLYDDHLTKVNLFKIFLYFDDTDAFWGNLIGKTILSSSFNQIYFYSKNVLLIYIVAQDAYIWESYFPTNTQLEFIPFYSLPTNLKYKLHYELANIFKHYNLQHKIKPKGVCWKYWNHGLAFWKSHPKKIDIDKIICPYGKSNNIFYLNVDLSWYQLWMEGCLEIVDTFIDNNY